MKLLTLATILLLILNRTQQFQLFSFQFKIFMVNLILIRTQCFKTVDCHVYKFSRHFDIDFVKYQIFQISYMLRIEVMIEVKQIERFYLLRTRFELIFFLLNNGRKSQTPKSSDFVLKRKKIV